MKLKSLKIKESTYKQLIKLKAQMEMEKEELISFDSLLNRLIHERNDK